MADEEPPPKKPVEGESRVNERGRVEEYHDYGEGGQWYRTGHVVSLPGGTPTSVAYGMMRGEGVYERKATADELAKQAVEQQRAAQPSAQVIDTSQMGQFQMAGYRPSPVNPNMQMVEIKSYVTPAGPGGTPSPALLMQYGKEVKAKPADTNYMFKQKELTFEEKYGQVAGGARQFFGGIPAIKEIGQVSEAFAGRADTKLSELEAIKSTQIAKEKARNAPTLPTELAFGFGETAIKTAKGASQIPAELAGMGSDVLSFSMFAPTDVKGAGKYAISQAQKPEVIVPAVLTGVSLLAPEVRGLGSVELKGLPMLFEKKGAAAVAGKLPSQLLGAGLDIGVPALIGGSYVASPEETTKTVGAYYVGFKAVGAAPKAYSEVFPERIPIKAQARATIEYVDLPGTEPQVYLAPKGAPITTPEVITAGKVDVSLVSKKPGRVDIISAGEIVGQGTAKTIPTELPFSKLPAGKAGIEAAGTFETVLTSKKGIIEGDLTYYGQSGKSYGGGVSSKPFEDLPKTKIGVYQPELGLAAKQPELSLKFETQNLAINAPQLLEQGISKFGLKIESDIGGITTLRNEKTGLRIKLPTTEISQALLTEFTKVPASVKEIEYVIEPAIPINGGYIGGTHYSPGTRTLDIYGKRIGAFETSTSNLKLKIGKDIFTFSEIGLGEIGKRIFPEKIKIFSSPIQIASESLYHEIGHSVQIHQLTPAEQGKWFKISRETKPISHYAATKAGQPIPYERELFAEYARYNEGLTDDTLPKNFNLEAANFVKEMTKKYSSAKIIPQEKPLVKTLGESKVSIQTGGTSLSIPSRGKGLVIGSAEKLIHEGAFATEEGVTYLFKGEKRELPGYLKGKKVIFEVEAPEYSVKDITTKDIARPELGFESDVFTGKKPPKLTEADVSLEITKRGSRPLPKNFPAAKEAKQPKLELSDAFKSILGKGGAVELTRTAPPSAKTAAGAASQALDITLKGMFDVGGATGGSIVLPPSLKFGKGRAPSGISPIEPTIFRTGEIGKTTVGVGLKQEFKQIGKERMREQTPPGINPPGFVPLEIQDLITTPKITRRQRETTGEVGYPRYPKTPPPETPSIVPIYGETVMPMTRLFGNLPGIGSEIGAGGKPRAKRVKGNLLDTLSVFKKVGK